MHRAHVSIRRRLALAGLVALLLVRSPALGQVITEPALKATYIYNFAKFTEWPPTVVSTGERLVLCVIGDRAVGDALARAVKGRLLASRGLVVMQLTPAGAPPMCHVLYVSGVSAVQAAKLIAGLPDVAVLTISDIEGFTEQGGIAQFFFEDGRLRFRVHLESAARARLQISSKLLAMARIGKD